MQVVLDLKETSEVNNSSPLAEASVTLSKKGLMVHVLHYLFNLSEYLFFNVFASGLLPCLFFYSSFRRVESKFLVRRWSSTAAINAGDPIPIWTKKPEQKLATMPLNMVLQRQHPYFPKNSNLKNLFHTALQSVFVMFT